MDIFLILTLILLLLAIILIIPYLMFRYGWIKSPFNERVAELFSKEQPIFIIVYSVAFLAALGAILSVYFSFAGYNVGIEVITPTLTPTFTATPNLTATAQAATAQILEARVATSEAQAATAVVVEATATAQAATAVVVEATATAQAVTIQAITAEAQAATAQALSTVTAQAAEAASATPATAQIITATVMAPTPMPTPISGNFLIENSTIWFEPANNSSYVGTAYVDDKIIVLGRNLGGDWVKIIAPNGKGWVEADRIELPVNISNLDILTLPPIPQEFRTLDINGGADIKERSILSRLNPYEEHIYKFFIEEDLLINITLLYYSEGTSTDQDVQFAIYDQRLYERYGYLDIGISQKIGASTKIDSDNEDPKILFWSGGTLTHGAEYYLRIVNGSPNTIHYCLVPDEAKDWSKCP